jgi:hypothetical protein
MPFPDPHELHWWVEGHLAPIDFVVVADAAAGDTAVDHRILEVLHTACIVPVAHHTVNTAVAADHWDPVVAVHTQGVSAAAAAAATVKALPVACLEGVVPDVAEEVAHPFQEPAVAVAAAAFPLEVPVAIVPEEAFAVQVEDPASAVVVIA